MLAMLADFPRYCGTASIVIDCVREVRALALEMNSIEITIINWRTVCVMNIWEKRLNLLEAASARDAAGANFGA